jgi:hypothetical protein
MSANPSALHNARGDHVLFSDGEFRHFRSPDRRGCGVDRANLVAIVSNARRGAEYDYPGTSNAAVHLLLVLAYIVSTIVPFFVSTATLARTLGVTLIFSVAAAAIIRRESLTSVWCFFAAMFSALILFAVSRAQAPNQISETTRGLVDAGGRRVDHA